LNDQVKEIKRKQQEAESWQELKKSLLQPLRLGVGVLLLGGGAFLYYKLFATG
jgi:hypothetical protein